MEGRTNVAAAAAATASAVHIKRSFVGCKSGSRWAAIRSRHYGRFGLGASDEPVNECRVGGRSRRTTILLCAL